MSLRSANRQSRHRFIKFTLCLALVGQLTACRKPNAQDLVGNWEVAYANSKLKLKLNQDGTFEQTLEQKDKTAVLRRTGKWEMADLEGESVVLNGALIVRDDKGTLESADSTGAWIIHIDWGFGRIRLPVNEDLNLYFDKIKN
jgi:hypothetical protein